MTCGLRTAWLGDGVRWRGVGGEVARRVGWLGVTPWLRLCCGEVRKARQRWEGASVAAGGREMAREAWALSFYSRKLGFGNGRG